MKPTMTPLEAALAFADLGHIDEPYNDQWWELAPQLYFHYNEGDEHVWDTALRILAAQVRADAAELAGWRKAAADWDCKTPEELQNNIDDLPAYGE